MERESHQIQQVAQLPSKREKSFLGNREREKLPNFVE